VHGKGHPMHSLFSGNIMSSVRRHLHEARSLSVIFENLKLVNGQHVQAVLLQASCHVSG
jgi:hypothetical protein